MRKADMKEPLFHLVSVRIDNGKETPLTRYPMGAQNAALISAAPDLLDALFIALPFVEDHEGSEAYKPEAVKNALKIIRTALEKAITQ